MMVAVRAGPMRIIHRKGMGFCPYFVYPVCAVHYERVFRTDAVARAPLGPSIRRASRPSSYLILFFSLLEKKVCWRVSSIEANSIILGQDGLRPSGYAGGRVGRLLERRLPVVGLFLW